MARAPDTSVLLHRLRELAGKPQLLGSEWRELQELARQAADLVSAAETVKEEARPGPISLAPPRKMRALRYGRFGGPGVISLETVPVPEPGPQEVLIKVRAVGVNPIDWKLREGRYPDRVTLPAIPGADVAGQIAEIGEQVEGWQIGQEVFGEIRLGACAQFVVAPIRLLAPMPRSLDFIQAAGVPLAAMTAWQGLFEHGQLESGQTVLIWGAAGGIGHFAVQLAKLRGAHVIGVASRDHLGFIGTLGADETLAHDGAEGMARLRDVDLVLDLVGHPEIQAASLKALRPGGLLVSTVLLPPVEEAEWQGVRARHFMVEPTGALLRQIARLFDDGKLRVAVTEILPLEEVARAHEISQQGHIHGKMVLTVE